MTYLTSTCAQRNRLTRAKPMAGHGARAEVKAQPGDSAETEP